MTNPILKESISKIMEEAGVLGVDLEVQPTKDPDSKLIINLDAAKVAVLGLVEINSQDVLVSYLINVHKWAWAEAEGFSREQIIDKFSSEVFKYVDIQDVVMKLS